MRLTPRRLGIGAAVIISLIVTATMLRLALEWRQALTDIDSMIVTPVELPLTEDAAPSSITIQSTGSQPNSSASTDIQPTAAPIAEGSDSSSPAPAAVTNEGDLALSAETMNILLLGTDERTGDVGPQRTDALVLVRLARDSGRVSMLSIPRDLWVDYSDGGEGRINGAYARGEMKYGPGGGAALAKSTVGDLLGLQVDHFVMINFQGFETIIDSLGGIMVDVPEAIYDPAYPTSDYQTIEVRFREGMQLMDGERALIYARTRHADNDFGRNQRQQLVLMSIFNRVRERGLLQQLTSLDDYTGALRDYVRTDLNRNRMLELANFARGINQDNILRYAIDSTAIYELRKPATFAAEPKALRRIVSQFTGESVSTAGGESE